MICTKCGIDFPLTEFYPYKSSSKGFRSACKTCDYVVEKKRLKGNTKAHKQKNLLKCFGITVEDFNNQLDYQNDVCSVCGDPNPISVDHCHSSGKIRGILCRSCNTMLGMAKDNPNTLLSGIKYLADPQVIIESKNPERLTRIKRYNKRAKEKRGFQ